MSAALHRASDLGLGVDYTQARRGITNPDEARQWYDLASAQLDYTETLQAGLDLLSLRRLMVLTQTLKAPVNEIEQASERLDQTSSPRDAARLLQTQGRR